MCCHSLLRLSYKETLNPSWVFVLALTQLLVLGEDSHHVIKQPPEEAAVVKAQASQQAT